MSAETTLPAGFAALEPFVAYWAAESLSERDTRRLDSSEAERLAFYDAAKDLAPSALDYLDSKTFGDYDDADHRLLDLMLGLIHATLAVEIERNEEHIHARGARRMPIVRERADPRSLVAAGPART
jgi:hypothetical protein